MGLDRWYKAQYRNRDVGVIGRLREEVVLFLKVHPAYSATTINRFMDWLERKWTLYYRQTEVGVCNWDEWKKTHPEDAALEENI